MQCKSDIIQASVLSSQTFVRVVEDGVLETTNVLKMLTSLLPNSGKLIPIKYTTITEGIVSIPLLGSAIFQNQFGLKTQHPIIPLLQNQSVNINDVAHKIVGIFNHHDQQRKEHRRCPIQRLFGLACYH
ncbi:PREDICTED: uncharacterized protein LOC108358254 isoform X1 [Rhagoletis zephyria]|uniref:uncharacterized protein LOC108358254 isoform X1 n=1 Tax=Rhagoletis zephyria TaxID=28612 RepID=UPI000811AA0F|nr:PREDICTED: uncharacterized protein LOC108358254 isoform X1 [Rhagoletis zephyria]